MSQLAPPRPKAHTHSRPGARRLTDTAVLLALAALLCGALAGGLLLAPRPPADDSAEASFARDMSAHHEQAVFMATIAQDRTLDPAIRITAFDIATTQQAQIGQFRGWLDAWGLSPTSTRLPMTWMGHPATAMPGMASPTQLRELQATRDPATIDERFLRLMIPHHQAGVAMASAILDQTQRAEVRRAAEQIIAGQRSEIGWMQRELARRGLPLVTGTVTMPTGEHGHEEQGFTGSLTGTAWQTARLLPVTLAVLALGWLLLDTWQRRRLDPRADGLLDDRTGRAAWLAAVAGLAASGAIHLGLAPEHFAEATTYGAFFVVAAVAALLLTGAMLALPRRLPALAGAGLLAGLVVAYALFRVVPPPGADGPEQFDLVGMLTQVVQLAGLSGCLWLLRGRGRMAANLGGEP